jgi:hypothetical protein
MKHKTPGIEKKRLADMGKIFSTDYSFKNISQSMILCRNKRQNQQL